MYCIYCGEKLSDDALFCLKCGKKITNKPQETETKVIKQEYIKETKAVEKTFDFRRDDAKVKSYRIRVPKTTISNIIASIISIIIGLLVIFGLGRFLGALHFGGFFSFINGFFILLGSMFLIFGIVHLLFPKKVIGTVLFAKQVKKLKYGMEINLVRAYLNGFNIEVEREINNGYMIRYFVSRKGGDYERLDCIFDSNGLLYDKAQSYSRTTYR